MLPVLVVLLTTPVAVLAVLPLHRRTRCWAPATRIWARSAGWLAIAAIEVYVYGLANISYFGISVRDICISRYGVWDGRYGHARYWPIARRCSELVDMVPGFVHPTLVVLLSGAATAALMAAGMAFFHGRSHSSVRS
ncbi:hypothetical protein [Micromonospora cathayae]|uniref:Uncharacterized protein n=1 Tax=Micromonospora cathayae TaxID=3028804 RepID=A0ABY7ZXP3_9ACTN|nr:hypothetical protein [Micromonospora sp. HUAS 3]WDZ86768.1 hypothetical protein PVK37_10410 [Micromonospora sp. HUAS 3]